jgi:hypothetical protein
MPQKQEIGHRLPAQMEVLLAFVSSPSGEAFWIFCHLLFPSYLYLS